MQTTAFICCDEETRALRLSGISDQPILVRIDALGQPAAAETARGKSVVYYGNIHAAGTRQLLSGAPSLGLLPGTLLVDGRKLAFQEFFAQHRKDPALQATRCIYLEADSGLLWDGNVLTVVGEGGVVVIQSRAEKTPDSADIAQYRAGETFLA